jgi:hypothetical protein
VFALAPESTATTSGRLIGPPELLELEELELEELELLEELDELDELELLELELLDELELLELELLEELDELEDELEPPPPQPVNREAHSAKASTGAETLGFIGIIFIWAPDVIVI